MALTTTGIEIQILSSIAAYQRFRDQCSTNDCKIVVSHLIRKYSEPLEKSGLTQRRVSVNVRNGKIDDTIWDHAVPVIALVEELLRWKDTHLEPTEQNLLRLKNFLKESLLLVQITREDDATLSSSGFQRCMPPGWSEYGNPLYRNPLARYIESGVEV